MIFSDQTIIETVERNQPYAIPNDIWNKRKHKITKDIIDLKEELEILNDIVEFAVEGIVDEFYNDFVGICLRLGLFIDRDGVAQVNEDVCFSFEDGLDNGEYYETIGQLENAILEEIEKRSV